MAFSVPEPAFRLEKWLVKKWIDSERRFWYCEKAKLQNLQRAARRFDALLPKDEFVALQELVLQRQAELHSAIRDTKLKKLQHLIQISQKQERTTSTSFAAPVINLSNEVFPENELQLLSRGKKFAVPSPPHQHEKQN